MANEYERLVTFAIPTRGFVDPKFMSHFQSVTDSVPTGTSYRVRITDKDKDTGEVMDVSSARNILVEGCLAEDKSKYLFFIDDDVFIPQNALAAMLQDNKDIVTGIYWSKTENPEPIIYKDMHLGPYFDFPRKSVFQIDAAGLGCCLIKTEVFNKIPKPWFKFEKENISEDFYFFMKAKELGIDLWCDSRILCYHLDMNTPQKFYPESFPE